MCLVSAEPAVGAGRAAGQRRALAAAQAHACTGPLLREEQDQLLQRKCPHSLLSACLLALALSTELGEGWWRGVRAGTGTEPGVARGEAEQCQRDVCSSFGGNPSGRIIPGELENTGREAAASLSRASFTRALVAEAGVQMGAVFMVTTFSFGAACPWQTPVLLAPRTSAVGRSFFVLSC